MTKDIKATSKEDIMMINRAATEAPYSVWIHGSNVLVDAKSLMGLFVLSPEDSLKLVVPDDADTRLLFTRLDSVIAH